MKRTRRNHGAAFKSQVALAAQFGSSHPDHGMEAAFAGAGRRRVWRHDPQAGRAGSHGLHAKIGQLALKNDFLEGALTKAGLLSAKR